MTVLITGGTGLLGRNLAQALVDQGKNVVLFDIDPPNESLADIQAEVDYVRGDVSNWSHVVNAVKKYQPDTIYHFAAILSAPSEKDPWSSFHVNCVGSFHVLEAARLFDVEKVVFSSSQLAVYAPEVEVPTDYTLQRPRLFYGITKVFVELLGRYYYNRFGVDFRSLRYDSIVAPGVDTPGVAQCFPLCIEHALQGEPFDLWYPKVMPVQFTYYKDAVQGAIQLARAPKEDIETRIYNVVGISTTAGTFAKTVEQEIPDADVGFQRGGGPLGRLPDRIQELILESAPKDVSDAHAREEWGWDPDYSLAKLIHDYRAEMQQ